MHRFFCSREDFSRGKVVIRDHEQVHHAKNVLRIKIGDRVIVSDGEGGEYQCSVITLSQDSIQCKLSGEKLLGSSRKSFSITVACALPKQGMDNIIDKLTQLGVDRIIPIETMRVIKRVHKESQGGLLRRWEKIALNSSQQSQRTILPVIEEIVDLEAVLDKQAHYDLKLIPTLLGERITLREALSKVEKYTNILLFIGPEGDFSPEEVALALRYGCLPITLGERVLRVETAAVAVVSFLQLFSV